MRTSDPKTLLTGLFRAAVDAARPSVVLAPHLPAPPAGRTVVVGGGKAAAAMAAAVEAEWPGPVAVVGDEVGNGVLFPGASLDREFGWSKEHPVVDAYRAYRGMPYDAPTHAAAAVLYAVRSQQNSTRAPS